MVKGRSVSEGEQTLSSDSDPDSPCFRLISVCVVISLLLRNVAVWVNSCTTRLQGMGVNVYGVFHTCSCSADKHMYKLTYPLNKTAAEFRHVL